MLIENKPKNDKLKTINKYQLLFLFFLRFFFFKKNKIFILNYIFSRRFHVKIVFIYFLFRINNNFSLYFNYLFMVIYS